jgi:hypothetical protein
LKPLVPQQAACLRDLVSVAISATSHPIPLANVSLFLSIFFTLINQISIITVSSVITGSLSLSANCHSYTTLIRNPLASARLKRSPSTSCELIILVALP